LFIVAETIDNDLPTGKQAKIKKTSYQGGRLVLTLPEGSAVADILNSLFADESSADNGTSAITAINQGQAAPATDVLEDKCNTKLAKKQADSEANGAEPKPKAEVHGMGEGYPAQIVR
jgi:hypothetical protein